MKIIQLQVELMQKSSKQELSSELQKFKKAYLNTICRKETNLRNKKDK